MLDLAQHDLAMALAQRVHYFQSRKGPAKEPYIQHVRRVAERVEGVRAKTIAWLHDVIEDTPITDDALEQIGFPQHIIEDVLALSRREETRNSDPLGRGDFHTYREPYFEFIERTIQDGSDDALRVKLADLADNLSDEWGGDSLRARYVKADAMVRRELEQRQTKAPTPSPDQ